MLIAPMSQAETLTSQENKVKAAFIYQFTNYVQWPHDAVKTEKSFVITVVGESGLASELKQIARLKTAQTRPIEIRVVNQDDPIGPSHIVIVSSSDAAHLQRVTAKVAALPVLVVGHGDHFAKKGAMINFFVEADRLRFEINRPLLEAAQLRVSSQLLKFAKLVD